MGDPFIGSEAIAAGRLTRYELHKGFVRLLRDVYVPRDTKVTAEVRAEAAWLWSGRRGVVAGLSAAAMHGSQWVDASHSVDIIHMNRFPNTGVRVRADAVGDDEIVRLGAMAVTTPERTALDLARWYPRDSAVAAIDALATFDAHTRTARVRGGTTIDIADALLLAERCKGRRGIEKARTTLSLVDFGAQSPQETWLRLLLVDDGLPVPTTQIEIPIRRSDKYIYLDMGWEHVKVAVEYDGEQHWRERSQYSWDVKRHEILKRKGWIVIRVMAGDKPADILKSVREALASRM